MTLYLEFTYLCGLVNQLEVTVSFLSEYLFRYKKIFLKKWTSSSCDCIFCNHVSRVYMRHVCDIWLASLIRYQTTSGDYATQWLVDWSWSHFVQKENISTRISWRELKHLLKITFAWRTFIVFLQLKVKQLSKTWSDQFQWFSLVKITKIKSIT